jgi:hypothetical protein
LEDLDAALVAVEADSFETVSGQKRLRVNGNLTLRGNNPSRLLIMRGSDVTARLEVDFPEVLGGTNEVFYRFGRNTTPLNQRFQLYLGATLVHELNSANGGSYPTTLCRQGQTLLVGGSATTGGSTPLAALEVQATGKGLLLPRLSTTQRDAVSGWPAGMLIYNTTVGKLQVRTASTWETVTSA